MKKVILDTNAYVQLMAGADEILTVLANADSVYMPVFVMGELYAGFKGGSKEHENEEILNKFLRQDIVRMIPASIETAELFGEIKTRLKQAGTPIPINDVWIAAQTFETGAYLITYDQHFLKVPGLLLWHNMEKVK